MEKAADWQHLLHHYAHDITWKPDTYNWVYFIDEGQKRACAWQESVFQCEHSLIQMFLYASLRTMSCSFCISWLSSHAAAPQGRFYKQVTMSKNTQHCSLRLFALLLNDKDSTTITKCIQILNSFENKNIYTHDSIKYETKSHDQFSRSAEWNTFQSTFFLHNESFFFRA